MEYLSPEFWGFVAILVLLLLLLAASALWQKIQAKKSSQGTGKESQQTSSEPLQKECKRSQSTQPSAQSTSQTKASELPEKVDSRQTFSSAKPIAVTLPRKGGMRGSRSTSPSAEVLAKFGIESLGSGSGSGSSHAPRYKSFAPKRTTHFH